MPIDVIESFDLYDDSIQPPLVSNGTIVSGRQSGRALRLQSSAQYGISTTLSYSLIVRFSYFWSGIAAPIISIGNYDGSTFRSHLYAYVVDFGRILIYRGSFGGASTFLASTTDLTMKVGQWYDVEFLSTIHSVQGVAELRVDGKSIASFSGNTNNHLAYPQSNRFVLHGPSTSYCLFDDLAATTSAITPGNSLDIGFLGPRLVESVLPNNIGDNSDWQPFGGTFNYQCVDQIPNAPIASQAAYVQANSTNLQDVYGMANLSKIDGNIYATRAICQTDDAAVKLMYRNSGTNSTSSTDAPATGSGRDYRSKIMPQDPITTSDWTTARVNSGQFGVES